MVQESFFLKKWSNDSTKPRTQQYLVGHGHHILLTILRTTTIQVQVGVSIALAPTALLKLKMLCYSIRSKLLFKHGRAFQIIGVSIEITEDVCAQNQQNSALCLSTGHLSLALDSVRANVNSEAPNFIHDFSSIWRTYK